MPGSRSGSTATRDARAVLRVWEGNSLIQDQEVKLPFSPDSPGGSPSDPSKPRHSNLPAFGSGRSRTRPFRRNNERSAVLHVRDLENRILYVEGRPRWEYKFIRSAVSDDRHLRLESLLRTAINKYYRQGIEEESTLAAGFPSTREELFSYRALVVGSVESSFFTYPQMEMLREFVDKRGGRVPHAGRQFLLFRRRIPEHAGGGAASGLDDARRRHGAIRHPLPAGVGPGRADSPGAPAPRLATGRRRIGQPAAVGRDARPQGLESGGGPSSRAPRSWPVSRMPRTGRTFP